MKNYINKMHPAILTTICMISGISFLGIVFMYPVIFLIAIVLAILGVIWKLMYDAIQVSRCNYRNNWKK